LTALSSITFFCRLQSVKCSKTSKKRREELECKKNEAETYDPIEKIKEEYIPYNEGIKAQPVPWITVETTEDLESNLNELPK